MQQRCVVGKLLDDLMPTHPLRWVVAFACLYIVFHMINVVFDQLLDVVPGRISIVFLPAFIKLASILIAGVAGLLGIAIGSFLIGFFVSHETVLTAAWLAAASASGVGIAYLGLRYASGNRPPAFSLPVLLVLAAMYCTFNAVLHGLTWAVVGIGADITLHDLTLMIIGDFAGVILMFYGLRLALKLYRQIKLVWASGRP
jgi:hypothetical protein